MDFFHKLIYEYDVDITKPNKPRQIPLTYA